MLYNYNYGKLTNGVFEYAPKNVNIGNTWYIPAKREHLIEAGYKQIANTPYPTDGKYYVSHWEIINDMITEVWEEDEPPVEPVEDKVLDLEDMMVDHEYRLTLLELGV